MTISEDEQESDIEVNKLNRKLLLIKLYDMIESFETKIAKGRIKDPQNEKIKVSQIKAFGYLCSVYNALSKDVELDEIKSEIEILEELLQK
jgi:hypothetical protein